jgi:exosome complex RNA-binding protein Rrp4
MEEKGGKKEKWGGYVDENGKLWVSKKKEKKYVLQKYNIFKHCREKTQWENCWKRFAKNLHLHHHKKLQKNNRDK